MLLRACWVAFPTVFFWRVAPANSVFCRAANSGTIPPDWAAWRLQWETGHALLFVLHLTALVLVAAAVAEAHRDRSPGWATVRTVRPCRRVGLSQRGRHSVSLSAPAACAASEHHVRDLLSRERSPWSEKDESWSPVQVERGAAVRRD